MPAPVLPDDKRALPRSTLLFWAGVALAAIAALLLLVADGNGTFRFAAVLALGSVVLIGLSITLRPDDGAAVQDLFDEIEELRAEIAAVQRSVNQPAEQAYRAPAAVAAVPRRSEDAPVGPAGERPGAGSSGWARVPVPEVSGVGPERPDEPEPLRVAESGGLRRRSAEPEDEPRRSEESGGRRRLADPEDGFRPADPPGGRRRSDETSGGPRRSDEPGGGRRRSDDEQGGGRRRSDEPGGGRRRLPDPAEERFDGPHRTDDDRGRYRARRHDDDHDRFTAGRDEDERDAYPGRRHADEEPAHRSRPAARYAAERPPSGVYGAPPRRDEHDVRPGGGPGPEVPPRPVGVVRHTETVHVTTRHTIVDGAGPDPVPGNVYGRWAPPPEEQGWPAAGPEPADRWDGYAPHPDHARSGHPRESAWPGPERAGRETPPTGRTRPGRDATEAWPGPEGARGRGGQPWTEPTRYGRTPGDDRPGSDGRGWDGADGHPGTGRAYPAEDAGTEHWSDVRAGDRWAAVRDDGHGRELRMGERRAAMHTDGTGTELRMENRWATVRRGDPRRERPDGGPDRSEPGYPDRGGRRSEPHHALPPGGVPVPDAWRTPRQRQPVDDWPSPDAPNRGPEPGPAGYGNPTRARDGHPPRGHDSRSPDRWR